MKPNPWLLPALTLLLVSGLVIHQKKSASALEARTEILKDRILKTHASGDTTVIDWKEFASNMGDSDDRPDVGTVMRIERLIRDLSPRELFEQLDKIEQLGLAEKCRDPLQQIIIAKLVESDPKGVLERFANQVGKENEFYNWAVSSALSRWAQKEPELAIVWLDQQIAAGRFNSKYLDGRNKPRMEFEKSLLASLIGTHPSAATARVMAMPRDRRMELIQRSFSYSQMKPEDDESYAILIRNCLASDECVNALASLTGNFSATDYGRIDAFISRTNATAEEKWSIVTAVLSNHIRVSMAREELETARNWAATQCPSPAVDTAIGTAIGNSLRFQDFAAVSDLLLAYQQSTGSDEILLSFLRNKSVRPYKERGVLAPLIASIKDPVLRGEMRRFYSNP